jgi:hypothetical protein
MMKKNSGDRKYSYKDPYEARQFATNVNNAGLHKKEAGIKSSLPLKERMQRIKKFTGCCRYRRLTVYYLYFKTSF